MTKIKRIACLLLVISLSLTVMLAGCGQTKEDPTPTTKEAADESKPADETTAEPELEHVDLIWYYMNAPQADEELVFEKANELIKEKINATVKFSPISGGSYQTKMQVVTQSGEDFDLAWTSHWRFNVSDQIKNEVFLPLNDIIDEYTPALKASMSEEMWDMQKFNGTIYGVFNQQLAFRQYGFTMLKEFVDKYNFDAANEIKEFKDIEKFLKLIKDNEKDIIPLERMDAYITDPYYNVYKLNVDSLAVYGDDPKTVINYDEAPETKEIMELKHDWFSKGYVSADVVGMTDFTAAKKAKKFASWVGTIGPDQDIKTKKNFDLDTVTVPVSEPELTADGPLATMTAVSANSENPERAVMLIELMHTDKDLYNLLTYGIEGTHYTKIDDTYIKIAEDKRYAANGWVMGNTFLGYLPEGQPKEQVELTKKLNNEAKKSPIIGFSADKTKIENELAALSTIWSEHGPLLNVAPDPVDTWYPDYLKQKEDAGIDKVKEEIQKQLDEFWANQ